MIEPEGNSGGGQGALFRDRPDQPEIIPGKTLLLAHQDLRLLLQSNI